MKDRLRKDGDPPLAGDEPDFEIDKGIFAFHVLLVVSLGAIAVWIDWSIPSAAFGFISGIAVYSLFWRWRYGHWPD